MSEEQPRAVVLGGCNGAGKTTASRALLADTLGMTTFVNADDIGRGLSGFQPERAAIAAGRVMLHRLHELADGRESFAFETTMAGKTHAGFLRELAEAGWRVELYYFWLANVELSLQRVASRVAAGGHDVPEPTLRQRFPRSVRNFLTLYRPIADWWEVYDNSERGESLLMARGTREGFPDIIDNVGWTALQEVARRV